MELKLGIVALLLGCGCVTPSAAERRMFKPPTCEEMRIEAETAKEWCYAPGVTIETRRSACLFYTEFENKCPARVIE